MNWIANEHIARERQQALLDESHHRHLLALETPSFKARVAKWLRKTADRLEPICKEAMRTPNPELASSK